MPRQVNQNVNAVVVDDFRGGQRVLADKFAPTDFVTLELFGDKIFSARRITRHGKIFGVVVLQQRRQKVRHDVFAEVGRDVTDVQLFFRVGIFFVVRERRHLREERIKFLREFFGLIGGHFAVIAQEQMLRVQLGGAVVLVGQRAGLKQGVGGACGFARQIQPV